MSSTTLIFTSFLRIIASSFNIVASFSKIIAVINLYICAVLIALKITCRSVYS